MSTSLADSNALAEKKLLRKLDLHLLPWVCVAYLVNYLDRSNLGNAKTLNSNVKGAGLGSQIDLTGIKYSIVIAAFFVPVILYGSSFFCFNEESEGRAVRIRSPCPLATTILGPVVNDITFLNPTMLHSTILCTPC